MGSRLVNKSAFVLKNVTVQDTDVEQIESSREIMN